MQAKGLPGARAKPRIRGVPLSAGLGLEVIRLMWPFCAECSAQCATARRLDRGA